MTISGGSAARDPRVDRTRAHVLDHARRLVASDGPGAVTYSELASRAGVTRQTLYRHWPTREAIFVDLVLAQSLGGLPDGTGTGEQIAARFLRRLRDDMDDPASAGSLVALIASADHEPTSSSALGHVVDTVSDALNAFVEPHGHRVTSEDYAMLCGPVIFMRLIAREAVSNRFIDAVVSAWAAGAGRRPAPAAHARGGADG